MIVDGYNVIFAWPELKQLSKESLEHARLQLRSDLMNYGAMKDYFIILVFDGKTGHSRPMEEKLSKRFMEVFTEDHVTADSYIEKAVFERKGRYVNVYVVTSDMEEQHQIYGFGGLRIPAKELRQDILQSKEEERKHYRGIPKNTMERSQRNEVYSNLQPDVMDKLEAIRRGLD